MADLFSYETSAIVTKPVVASMDWRCGRCTETLRRLSTATRCPRCGALNDCTGIPVGMEIEPLPFGVVHDKCGTLLTNAATKAREAIYCVHCRRGSTPGLSSTVRYISYSDVTFRSKRVGPVEAIRTCFAKFLQFDGRATRAEFAWFHLLFFVVNFIAAMADRFIFGGLGALQWLVMLGLGLPWFAVLTRRLHDIDLTGMHVVAIVLLPLSFILLVLMSEWMLLAGVIVWLVYALSLILFGAVPSAIGANRYGINQFGDGIIRVPAAVASALKACDEHARAVSAAE